MGKIDNKPGSLAEILHASYVSRVMNPGKNLPEWEQRLSSTGVGLTPSGKEGPEWYR